MCALVVVLRSGTLSVDHLAGMITTCVGNASTSGVPRIVHTIGTGENLGEDLQGWTVVAYPNVIDAMWSEFPDYFETFVNLRHNSLRLELFQYCLLDEKGGVFITDSTIVNGTALESTFGGSACGVPMVYLDTMSSWMFHSVRSFGIDVMAAPRGSCLVRCALDEIKINVEAYHRKNKRGDVMGVCTKRCPFHIFGLAIKNLTLAGHNGAPLFTLPHREPLI